MFSKTNGPIGHYMGLESTLYSKPEDNARLISPKFINNPSGFCLKWFFHMWGVLDRGELRVNIESDNEKTTMWRFAENVGNIWNAAQISIQIPDSYKDFRIVFEGLLFLIKKSITILIIKFF